MGDVALAHIIPGAPSPGELIKTAIQLKKIYDTFCHKHKNATKQVRDLASLVNTFSINLANQGLILERAGRFFPNGDKFQETICECDDFLHDYEALLLNKPGRARKVWHTVQWSFEDESKRLMDKLNTHTQAMNSFSLNVLLGIALHDQEAVHSSAKRSNRLVIPDDDPALQRFEELYERLYDQVVKFQNHQKRSNATSIELQPQFDAILVEWRRILVESGMSESKIPRLPEVNSRQAASSAAQHLRRAMAAEDRQNNWQCNVAFIDPFSSTDRQSVAVLQTPPPPSEQHGATRHSSLMLSQPPSPVFSYHPSPTPTQASTVTTSTTGTERRRSSVEDHIVAVKARVRVGGHEVKLSSYKIRNNGRSLTLIWNSGSLHQVEQKPQLGRTGCPFTLHSDLIEDPHVVCFLENQEIRYAGKKYEDNPRYHFSSAEESRDFQSALRRRQLVSTHEVEKICTSTSLKPGEATDQHLKIWKSLKAERYYLWYYANNDLNQARREFSITWFEENISTFVTNGEETLRLSFKTVKRERQGSFRRLSRKFSSSRDIRPMPALSSDSPSSSQARKASIASNNSTSTQIDQSESCVPDEEAQRLAYLDIVFTSENDRDGFVSSFTEAREAMSRAQASV